MSDIYSETRSSNKVGINVFLAEASGSIERVAKLLSGIPNGAEKAIGSAIKRASRSGETHASKAIRAEYTIKAGDIKKYTNVEQHYESDLTGTTVYINFRGIHIPLINFDTTVGRNGVISTRVKRTSAKVTLDNAFKATVGTGNHTGIFERKTSKRLPIEQKYGPSTPQMMSANDDLSQEVGDKIREVFDDRLNYELLRVLNGWGV